MLKMRLQRIGRRNNPSYRVLVVDSRQGPKSGKFVDTIGSYDPKDNRIALDGERARSWIAKGVQVSPTVHNLLVGQQIIEGKKINVLPKKSPIKQEGADAPEAAPAPDAASETPEATEQPEAATADDAQQADAPAEEKQETVA